MTATPVTIKKLINFLLLAFSLVPYWQWGNNNRGFIAEAEWEVLQKLVTHPAAAAHPLTLIPLAAQLLLLFSLFQKEPGKWILFIALPGLGILLLLLLFTGIIKMEWITILSVLPFFITGIAAMVYYRRYRVKPDAR